MKIDIDIKEDGKNVIINYNKKKQVFDFEKLFNSDKQLLGECDLKDYYYEPRKINGSKAYLFCKNNKLYVTFQANKVFNRKSFMFSKITKKNVIFWGFYSDISNRIKDCDYLYLNDKKVGKLKRPFKFSIFKHFAIAKIKVLDVLNYGSVHSSVMVGDKNNNTVSIRRKQFRKGICYYSRKRIGNNYLIVRCTANNDRLKIVNIPMQPEYTTINMIKNFIASKIYKPCKLFYKPIVLMFEKGSCKANESGYYIFEKIMQRKDIKSKVYFIIDKNSSDFEKVYNKYPKNIIIKYTFKHYLYIYLSKYFISSESSNHVINSRLSIRNLNKIIRNKPLIFLQHGIMFAKPVDNPAASGFRKDNDSVNFYKCVVSSDLEATQFYKLGFDNNDLIKCGLTKFDVSVQSPKADKIMFMPTYRYWEETQAMNPNTVKDTSYYKNYIAVIDKFKESGLLDKLSISCHPKFAEYLIDANPIFEKIIEKDINKGLENAKIFITDYSSASYDAHYRGAYIIYDWAERDYLIENYHAIPPVNEKNCDGVPVFSNDELIKEVKRAIAKNYKMDKKYEDRYKKINEFHDGKNGDRLINELKKLNII